MVLNGNVTVDSYNSDNGLPGTGNSTHNGDVGSNGTITANGSVSIDGDVAWGTSGKFVKNGNVSVSGTQSSQSDVDMTAVTVPAALDALSSSGAFLLNGNKTSTLYSGSYRYSSITLNGNSSLILNGAVDIYLTGLLIVNGSSQIVIPYGCGPVNIYSDGNITFNGVVNNTNATDALFIYGTSTSSQNITFNGNIPFFGTIYAPGATVTVNGNNSIYGVVAAKKIVINGSGIVHYDETLAALGGSGSSSGSSFWQEQ
jgi:cytoskeletal protein CcmA (bactofilin family)